MKIASKIALLLLALGATFAVAANNLTNVQHVIIVIQENRTPDNLFNQDSVLAANGGHVVPDLIPDPINSGLCLQKGTEHYISLQPTPLFTCWDPDHSHGQFGSGKGAWENTWDNGGMDGACSDSITNSSCGLPACATNGPNNSNSCPYAYVNNALWLGGVGGPYHILDPYFQIANQYGFANFMFQTNQGPSFPAHQFLLSGTSAPDQYNLTDDCGPMHNSYPCYQWFAAENYAESGGWGCSTTGANIWEVGPTTNSPGNEFEGVWYMGIPCYKHQTLVTLLDNAQLTWKYYAQSVTAGKDLWTAPNASENICQPSNGISGPCSTTGEWQTNVADVTPYSGSYDAAPILDDIENTNCTALPNVSWVIPDGNWSDHADKGPTGDGGPSWVAAIANAIGNSGCGYWDNTVILVTWDDWGGWYDDVTPPDCQTSPCTGYSNNTGQQYVYGFRVPLLVIGAYVKSGYISGVGGSSANCSTSTYCHDFGSILNFIEYAFGLPQGGIGDPNWPYADALAMDYNPNNPGSYSLSDFFDFTQNARGFQQINGAKYPERCFHTPSGTGCFPNYPLDPDNDANEGN